MAKGDRPDDQSDRHRCDDSNENSERIGQLQAQDVLGRRRGRPDGEDKSHVRADGDVTVISEVEVAGPAPDDVEPQRHDPEDGTLRDDGDEVRAHSKTVLRALVKSPRGRTRMTNARIANAIARL